MMAAKVAAQVRAEADVEYHKACRDALACSGLFLAWCVYCVASPELTGIGQAFGVLLSAVLATGLLFAVPQAVALTAVREGVEGNRNAAARWSLAVVLTVPWGFTGLIASGSWLVAAGAAIGVLPLLVFTVSTLVQVTVAEYRHVAARILLAHADRAAVAEIGYDEDTAPTPATEPADGSRERRRL